MAPVPMSKVHFTNSGSEANDTVIKLLWYRSNAMGQPQRKKIISRIRGYHGVTVASASLTGLPNNHRSFDLPIPQVLHAGLPHWMSQHREGEDEEAFATRLADELEAMIQAEGPDTIAAFIGEPVMGAGGVVVPPRTYWEKIQAVLARHDILLVADEVICGFGRTGRMFGSQTLRPGARRDGGLQAAHLLLLPDVGHRDERARVRARRRRERPHRHLRPRASPPRPTPWARPWRWRTSLSSRSATWSPARPRWAPTCRSACAPWGTIRWWRRCAAWA